jgi:CRISPR-associated exonuclease Cas4
VDDIRITGVMIQYYFTCKRELWFFSKQINFDFDNEDMLIGKIIHELFYENTKSFSNFIIDDTISLDLLKTKDDVVLVYEIKKSSKLKEPPKYQLYYYLYYLKNKFGINAKGVLVYPKEKKREILTLNEYIEKELEKAIKEIPKIVKLEKPPNAIYKKYCKKCSYYEFCWC